MDNSNLMARLLDERGINHYILRDDEETGGAWKIVYKYQGMWQELNGKTNIGELYFLDEPTLQELELRE